MEIINHTFNKGERLKSTLEIAALFEKGKAFLVYPLKIVWIEKSGYCAFPVKAAFTVSKKNIRRATCRNTLKRRIKEAYRLHKHLLYEKLSDNKLDCIFIYIAREELPYNIIEKSIKAALKKLANLQRIVI
jgi:ribonuclease P protein component